jgi:hypothetical protein
MQLIMDMPKFIHKQYPSNYKLPNDVKFIQNNSIEQCSLEKVKSEDYEE